jgi:hypothetical protein
MGNLGSNMKVLNRTCTSSTKKNSVAAGMTVPEHRCNQKMRGDLFGLSFPGDSATTTVFTVERTKMPQAKNYYVLKDLKLPSQSKTAYRTGPTIMH